MNRCHFRLKEFVCLLSFCAVLVAVRAEGLQTDQQNAPTKPTKKNPMPAQTNPSPASQASYSPFDAISRKPTSEQFDASSLTACDEKNQSGQAVSFNDAVSSFVKNAETSDATCIIERVASAHSGSPTSMDLLADGNAVILHVMTWKRTLVKSTDPKYTGHTYQYQPDKGAWGFYRIKNNKKETTFKQQVDLSGTPYFFRAKMIYVMDVNSGLVDCGTDSNNDPVCAPPVDVAYNIQTTARQKQNQTDFATLVSTLLKISSGTTQNAVGLPAPTRIYWGTVTTVAPTVPVPYDVPVTATYSASQSPINQSATTSVQLACNIAQPSSQNAPGNQNTTDNQNGPTGQDGPSDQNSTGNQNTSSSQTELDSPSKQKTQGGQSNQTSCSVSRTVAHYDPEYWDVSVGVAIPGPIEMTYKSSTSSSGATTVTPSKVTHTDAYAFFDVYLLEHFSSLPANQSWIPHINAGIPITGQTLHRPYVGLAENLGFLTKYAKLNIPLSVFAGPVFMKQQVELPGTTTLKWDRATKMIYGIELPISSITNYLKSGGGSKNNSSSKSSNSSSQ